MNDKPEINHPSHYNRGKMEAIDFIELLGHGEGFCMGNAVKYLIRYDAKDDRASNLKKACWYLTRLVRSSSKGWAQTWALALPAEEVAARTEKIGELYPYLPREVAECICYIASHHITTARDLLVSFLRREGIEPEVD